MKKRNRQWLSVALSVIGAGLIVLSAAAVGMSFLRQNKAEEKREDILSKMEEILPEASPAGLPERRDEAMPALTVNGEDLIAVLSFPACNVKLPVGAYWDKDKVHYYPCRYSGSIFGERLVLGGMDTGLSDAVCITDTVYLTDTEGNRYTYTVTQAEKIKEPSEQAFEKYEGELLIFLRDMYSLDYTLVCCSINK